MAEQSFTSVELAGMSLALHSVQQRPRDVGVRATRIESGPGKVVVPALTTAVFVSSE